MMSSAARRACMLIVAALMLPAILCSQGTLETARNAYRAAYPVEWPAGPLQDSAPKWAQTGLIRFSRWDGGRIETAKAALSGWPGFWPPDPDIFYATTNWYDPQTVRFLREAGVNMVWVTFSNGFSNQTEKRHEAQVARYIEECHRQGIHVMAYESIANMFWQDMYKNVPQSRRWASIGKNGKPVPYGAGEYTRVGYISRYMADLGNPEWLAYLRKRVDLALEAGADGIMYDNNFSSNMGTLLNVYRQIYQYGSSRKKDFLLMGNFHRDTYVFNRLTNCMTTEDGREPGIYDKGHTDLVPDKQYAARAGQGLIVDNIGLFRLLSALSDGWKPDMVEDGRREYGVRETSQMSPARQQLALAEAASFGVTEEVFVEDAFATGLWNSDPKALQVLAAIGKYNRFFANHEEFYAGTRSVAPVAVVLDDSSNGVGLLNGLAARNVLFDVIYERDLTASKLAPYSAVALLTAHTVGDRGLAALESWLRNGGKLFVAGQAATLDERGRARTRPFFFGHKLGKGQCTTFDQIPPPGKLAGLLIAAAGARQPRLEAPPGVVYNVVEQRKAGRSIVHLLNYGSAPVRNFKVELPKKYRSATLLSPDTPRALQLRMDQSTAGSAVTIPRLSIYALLVFTQT